MFQNSDGQSVAAGRARTYIDTNRTLAERLLALAEHLDPSEKSLIEGVYERGLKPSEIARMVNEEPAKMRRRLQSVLFRLRKPEFSFIVEQRLSWPRLRRQVAELSFLQNKSQKEIAESMRVSLYRVRYEISAIRILIEQANVMGRLK